MVRIGISSYLSTQSDIEVVGEGSSGKEAIEKDMRQIFFYLCRRFYTVHIIH
jgi:DNA-binding NarL/FixJ family response regulator